ncbi:hypothetical protein QE152_g34185 [Popillia japonica]|uniref:Uncharacterized protein n=1 Tax=Popillia japonica TaxID=7064 RepID=A0AAW1IU01_POPJA
MAATPLPFLQAVNSRLTTVHCLMFDHLSRYISEKYHKLQQNFLLSFIHMKQPAILYEICNKVWIAR